MSGFPLILKPDEEEAEGAEIFVDGKIGGRAYRFLLDTGAAKTSVLPDEYTSTFSSSETHHSSGVFAQSSEDLITVPSIEVGPILKKNFTVVRSATNGTGKGSLIGMDLLKDFRCHFLFDQARVLIDEEDESGTDYPILALLLDQRFHPYVDVQFGTSIAKAVLDTGASMTVVDLNFVQKHPDAFHEIGHATGTDSIGAQMETPTFLMTVTLIGDCPFPPHKAAGVDLSAVNATLEVPMDLILGYSTLSQANWWFDFPRKQWAISKRLSI